MKIFPAILMFVGYCSAVFDEIEDIQVDTSGANMRLKAIKECPLLASSMLHHDYKDKFNEIMPLNMVVSMYRLVEVDDLQQGISFVGAIDLTLTIENCGYENGTEMFYTVNDPNQWYPIIFHHSSKEDFFLPNGQVPTFVPIFVHSPFAI